MKSIDVAIQEAGIVATAPNGSCQAWSAKLQLKALAGMPPGTNVWDDPAMRPAGHPIASNAGVRVALAHAVSGDTLVLTPESLGATYTGGLRLEGQTFLPVMSMAVSKFNALDLAVQLALINAHDSVLTESVNGIVRHVFIVNLQSEIVRLRARLEFLTDFLVVYMGAHGVGP